MFQNFTDLDLDQFWKFKFHFDHFPRNTWFLSFDGPTNYFYLFKNRRQTFLWPGERPSYLGKVTKMRFGPNIKYLLEPFFADFRCREGISCIAIRQNNIVMVLKTHRFLCVRLVYVFLFRSVNWNMLGNTGFT